MRRYLVSLVPTAAMLTVVIAACGSGNAGLTQQTALPPLQTNGNQWNTLPTLPTTLTQSTVPGQTDIASTGIPPYTAQPGDYPLLIMKAYDGCTWQDVAEFNGRDPEKLFEGDIINFPPTCVLKGDPVAGEAPATTGGQAATGTEAPTATASVDGSFPYTVKDNDTVFGIAKNFDVKVADLIAVNGWPSDPQDVKIYPGDDIKIPGSPG